MTKIHFNWSKRNVIGNCPLCVGFLQNKLGAELHVCSHCGLIIRRNTDGLELLYRSGWQTPFENLNLTGGTTAGLAKNYAKELIRTLGVKNLNGYKLLDFGGGRGELAQALHQEGANVIAVDPYSYDQLKEKGIFAIPSLNELASGEDFNGVTAIDVIEHLINPLEELNKIRKILIPGGWLYLSTPNARGLNARVNRDKWLEAQNPSHLLLFTPKSIELALEKAGFKHYQRLSWRVDYSDNRLIQAKDWLLRMGKLDGVLRYLAYA